MSGTDPSAVATQARAITEAIPESFDHVEVYDQLIPSSTKTLRR